MFNSIKSIAESKKNKENKKYDINHLYIGYRQVSIYEDDLYVTYPHYECFYANGVFSKENISSFTRLTGDCLTNKPVYININSSNSSFLVNTCIKENNTTYCLNLNIKIFTNPQKQQISLNEINAKIDEINKVNKNYEKAKTYNSIYNITLQK